MSQARPNPDTNAFPRGAMPAWDGALHRQHHLMHAGLGFRGLGRGVEGFRASSLGVRFGI